MNYCFYFDNPFDRIDLIDCHDLKEAVTILLDHMTDNHIPFHRLCWHYKAGRRVKTFKYDYITFIEKELLS